MSNPHPRPWHRHSVFGDGPRVPMCRERRAVWKARIEIHRRAGRITDGEAYVGLALLKRLGQDGRCDPSHQTLGRRQRGEREHRPAGSEGLFRLWHGVMDPPPRA